MDDIIFIGDWVKDRVLGSGSFGTVVLWKHKNTDERLAIKTCKWGDELTAKHKERWTKEVEMMQNCNNANIVGTKELPAEFVAGLAPANPSRLPVLCMEYCSGGDLRQLLNKPESGAGLAELQARRILRDVCHALQFLHLHKITHRDLKPENIVLHVDPAPAALPAHNNRKVTYKLIDLGYAKEIDSNSVCASFVGTLQYLAPEILYSKTYSNSVDYWSFGLLAFEVICGMRPFLPFMAPVQWMPYVKKKSHDNICVYETFHGDIEYSNEVFPENHVSNAFKVLIEDWLRVALEWDPKLRGRDAPSKVTFNIPEEKGNTSNIVIFKLLESILSTKIIKVFSVYTLSSLSYKIDESTTIGKLKELISKDTTIPVQDQILLSQSTYTDIDNDDKVLKYWNENCNTMLFLHNKNEFIKDHLEPIVPKAIQRCLEHPKALYNFKNGQNLYRHGLHFVISQMEIYDSLINGLFTRGEAMKHQSKQLLLQHNVVDKNIGKLLAQVEIVSKTAEIGKKHIQNIKDSGVGTNYLGGFEKVFKNTDDLTEKIGKLQMAWSQLSVRLQSAARRSNETVDLNNFVTKYNYQTIYTNAMKAYITYKKSEFYNDHRTKEKQCNDIMRICYDCLRLRSKILSEIKNQPFVLKLLDLSTEFSKISHTVTTASNNTDKLIRDLSSVADELTNCTWATLSVLASDAENLGDLPYSVVSFQKRDFKIGESVSNHCIKTTNNSEVDEKLKSLIEESLKIRQYHASLTEKLNSQKQVMNKTSLDFSFLNET